jgi:hypothetical protein
MKVLLTDASGLTARQLSTILSLKNHTVHVLSPRGITLTKTTRHVSHVHRVPPFGLDPYAWLDAALAVISNEKDKFNVLICSQEQVAVISAEIDRVRATGVAVAVPEFGALRKVMDKVSACSTLRNYGLSQPESAIITSIQDLDEKNSKFEDFIPGFVKLPIATGSTGVRRVLSIHELRATCLDWGVFEKGKEGKVLVQKEITGPLLMICGVFSRGQLVAWHSCLRAREGINGGASIKISLPLPIIQRDLERLGMELKWHGGLSLDAIMVEKGGEKELYYIDVNPRIVEPMNGLLAGVDLVSAMLGVSLATDGDEGEWWDGVVRKGKEGVVTHQLVLALLAAAYRGRGALVRELWGTVSGTGLYKGSVEELTPIEEDWWSVLVQIVLTVCLLIGGRRLAEWVSGGTVANYAVSPEGWEEISRRVDERERDKI